MKKKNRFLLFALASAAAVGYSAYEGRGVFNKVRFKKVHEAVGGYVDTHYPNCFYSPSSKAQHGYLTTITTPHGRVILYITEARNGMFVFEEKKIEL